MLTETTRLLISIGIGLIVAAVFVGLCLLVKSFGNTKGWDRDDELY